jgi:hypothetical protein
MHRRLTASTLLLLVTSLGACSDDESDGADGPTAPTPTTTVDARPDGPAAELEALTGGNGVFVASLGGPDLAAAGWVEEEYAASGTAVSYGSATDLPTDGTFELEARLEDEFRTRVLVRRPADPSEFNGTVVVEWLNVSGGLDASPDFSYLADELLRGGYAWVGVSAQLIGVEGGEVAVTIEAAGDVAGQGLRNIDAERYGSLSHPGDAYSYDIFTQVARAVRAGRDGVLGALDPEVVLAAGESQSAFALTTYANGVQPLTEAFDGFLIHSRGAAAAPLGVPGAAIDIAGTIGLPPTRLRTDLPVPVLVVETETDVGGFLNYQAARQPDTDLLRVWEIAGTAHADAYLLGPMADAIGCTRPINDGPHHFVVKAALRHLDTWIRAGDVPPTAGPIELEAGTIARDGDGNALGGIRTPHVDVPVATLSGDPSPGGSIACTLMGSTTSLAPERVGTLYPSVDDYLTAYEAAADAAIEAGFVLAEDRDALLAEADPDAIGG